MQINIYIGEETMGELGSGSDQFPLTLESLKEVTAGMITGFDQDTLVVTVTDEQDIPIGMIRLIRGKVTFQYLLHLEIQKLTYLTSAVFNHL
ncbi:MAG: hypothetical protein H6774_00270 [Pseudomonadales bacterium]|nr:hypothetical protein [Pseudomonadales bacterium]